MGKKRKSGGRSKGSSGTSKNVQCSKCGRLVPADKAKKYTGRTNLVDWQLQKELEKDGAYVSGKTITKYYCISCAVHSGKVKIRERDKRKS